jgi:heme exporter protein D
VITTIATIVLYVCAAVCILVGVRAHRSTRQLVAVRHQLEARLQQAAEDRAFARWANWTMLSVTDNKGYVHASTLRQLYSAGRWDAVWEAPIAVSLWHGDPDVVKRWEQDIQHERDQRG